MAAVPKALVLLLILCFSLVAAQRLTNQTVSFSFSNLGYSSTWSVSSLLAQDGLLIVALDYQAWFPNSTSTNTTILSFYITQEAGFVLLDNITVPAQCDSQLLSGDSNQFLLACLPSISAGPAEFYFFSVSPAGSLKIDQNVHGPMNVAAGIFQQGSTSNFWMCGYVAQGNSLHINIYRLDASQGTITELKSNLLSVKDSDDHFWFRVAGVSPSGDLLLINFANRSSHYQLLEYSTSSWKLLQRESDTTAAPIAFLNPQASLLVTNLNNSTLIQVANFSTWYEHQNTMISS